MSETFWNVLGLAPTTDERVIKKAYTSRLKVTSPEKDPAGYMKLREAYENAKQYLAMQAYLADVQASSTDDESLDPSPAAAAASTTLTHSDLAHPDSSHPNPNTGPSSADPAYSEPTYSEPVAAESPQQRAFSELHSLLSRGDRDTFLQKLAEAKTSDTFASLDDQYHFVGEVARLIQEHRIEDTEWCGRVAELLGAREHENIFEHGSRYWFAYESLLRSYSELLGDRTQAHLDQQHDSEVSPGYLHVYHVLTSPFDAERLSALTRSQGYLRLAEIVMERAKLDPSIVIPRENREWWERTAMAGQHRPIAAPAGFTVTQPLPKKEESRVPLWIMWATFVVLLQLLRACPGHDRASHTLPPVTVPVPLEVHREALGIGGSQSGATTDPFMRQLALCDKKMRESILAHLYISQARQHSNAEDDPIVKLMLEKCHAKEFFDEEGQLKEMPWNR